MHALSDAAGFSVFVLANTDPEFRRNAGVGDSTPAWLRQLTWRQVAQIVATFASFCVTKTRSYSGGNMRKSLCVVFSAFLGITPLVSAQGGSQRDIRADERQMQELEWRLREDQNRLAYDRSHHAGRTQIRADELRVRNDKLAIRNLRADIKRDRQRRRRYRREGA